MNNALPDPSEYDDIRIIDSIEEYYLRDVVGVNFTDGGIINTVLAESLSQPMAESFVRVLCDRHWKRVFHDREFGTGPVKA